MAFRFVRSSVQVAQRLSRSGVPSVHKSLASTFQTQKRVFGSSIGTMSQFPGAQSVFVDTLEEAWIPELEETGIPCYRIMEEDGSIQEADDPKLSKAASLKMYKAMVNLSVMDNLLHQSQRQERLSFYMTNSGEEGAQIGTSSALSPEDVIFGQYREAGVLMYRGFTFKEFVDQCTTNKYDPGNGRQMPVHYGSRELNFHVISSPLATQIPHATGAAYALKRQGGNRCVAVYFGDGAASEGDFHAALNFASTLDCPVLFICRNNGYAISTPVKDQYRGDGIASRGTGYGIRTIRVDGNDVWAVHTATAAARDYAITNNRPVLIELMTYRIGSHSTSDDPTRYRSNDEVDYWAQKSNPIARFRAYLENKGWWDEKQEKKLRDAARKEVLSELTRAEKEKKSGLQYLFTDVYDTPPPRLLEQEKQMREHLAKYSEHYNLDKFATE